MEEKTFKSKLIYKGKILSLRLDDVILPNGKTTTREIVEHPGAVAILPLIDKDKFLLVKQFRTPIRKTLLEIPAGKIEKGENIKECAKRELIEETGYKTDNLKKLASVYLAPGYSSEIIHIFLAKNLKKSIANPDDDEVIQNVILERKEALNKIISGEINDSKTIIAVMLYFQLGKDFVS
ncbi:MAG: NUDIX hydrolase [Candidatus Omnitrophota bacterium]